MKHIKYVIHPGFVISRTDGDAHYVSAPDLMSLYGVDPAKCYTVYPGEPFRVEDYNKATHLFPDYSGEYKLPE